MNIFGFESFIQLIQRDQPLQFMFVSVVGFHFVIGEWTVLYVHIVRPAMHLIYQRIMNWPHGIKCWNFVAFSKKPSREEKTTSKCISNRFTDIKIRLRTHFDEIRKKTPSYFIFINKSGITLIFGSVIHWCTRHKLVFISSHTANDL